VSVYGGDFEGYCRRQAAGWACGTIQKLAPHFEVRAVPDGWQVLWAPRFPGDEAIVFETPDGGEVHTHAALIAFAHRVVEQLGGGIQ
jgi:hypothetical protein